MSKQVRSRRGSLRSKFSEKEAKILQTLDALLRGPRVRLKLDEIATRVEQKLLDDADALLAWEPVPLDIYGRTLPAGIQSSWKFVLRAGTTSGAERHPNSRQRMMAWRGTGDMQIWNGSKWQSNVLTDDETSPWDERWISIPVNGWHKPVMGPQTWVVVSFHTVLADELIEERGDPQGSGETQQHTYAEMAGEDRRGAR